MEQLKIDHTLYCYSHTSICMLAETRGNQTTIKKIAWHSRAMAMTLTVKVYTHFDIKKLVNAINKI